jgi:hypothetical protein
MPPILQPSLLNAGLSQLLPSVSDCNNETTLKTFTAGESRKNMFLVFQCVQHKKKNTWQRLPAYSTHFPNNTGSTPVLKLWTNRLSSCWDVIVQKFLRRYRNVWHVSKVECSLIHKLPELMHWNKYLSAKENPSQILHGTVLSQTFCWRTCLYFMSIPIERAGLSCIAIPVNLLSHTFHGPSSGLCSLHILSYFSHITNCTVKLVFPFYCKEWILGKGKWLSHWESTRQGMGTERLVASETILFP